MRYYKVEVTKVCTKEIYIQVPNDYDTDDLDADELGKKLSGVEWKIEYFERNAAKHIKKSDAKDNHIHEITE